MSTNLTIISGSSGVQTKWEDSTIDAKHNLGDLARSNDGSYFRYCQAGAVDLIVGTVLQRAAPIANHLALTAPAVAIGATSFSCTPGATGGAANLYAGGYVQVDTGPDPGGRYVISGHPAITSSVAFTLTLEEAVRVAWTTSTRLGLHHHPCKNVIIAPTVLTAPAVGIAVSIIPATYYGWMLVDGLWPVLMNGTPGVGIGVTNGATTAGSVDVITTTNLVTSRQIGYMAQVGVSTKYNMVHVQLM